MGNLAEPVTKVMEETSTKVSEKKSKGYTEYCYGCNKPFEQEEYNQRYCTLECKNTSEKEKREKEIESRIIATIPERFREVKTTREAIMDNSLFCYGPVGTGKTQYVAEVVRAYIKSGKNVRWLSCPVFVMRAQSYYRKDSGDPFEYVLDIANNEDPLVLDDIGIEKMSDWVRQIMYMLINERYQMNYITLITSNKSLQEIDELIHPGIASRIAGMGRVMYFKGEDFRLKK